MRYRFRLVMAVLTGMAIWLIFTFIYKQSNGFTPWIGILMILLVSGITEPRKCAGLSALMGLGAGLVIALQSISQNPRTGTLLDFIIGWMILGFSLCFYALLFALLGFVLGTIAKLYRKGVIF